MENIVYCDHSDDVIELQQKNVTDINIPLKMVSKIEITVENYRSDDYISEKLPVTGYKFKCPYCESLGKNPYVVFTNEIKNPNSTDNFVRFKKRGENLVKDHINSDSDVDPQVDPRNSVMYTHGELI